MVHDCGDFFSKGDLSIWCRLEIHGMSDTADVRATDSTRSFKTLQGSRTQWRYVLGHWAEAFRPRIRQI